MGLGITPGHIVVTPWAPTWPAAFREECARLATAFGALETAIEHVGSTAVPGLAAKPVIDVMIGLPTLDEAPPLIAILKTLGYEYVAAFEAVMPERRYLRRDQDGQRTHHIHMVERDGAFWVRHLAFRDFLRAHPAQAQAYGRLKFQLAGLHPRDAGAYMDGKDGLIKHLEALALEWRATAGRWAEEAPDDRR